MTPRGKGLLIRWGIFVVLGVGLFVLLSPFFYRPQIFSSSSVNLSDVGVTLQSGDRPGTILVKVDDREETIPSTQLGNTPLSSEAMQRIDRNNRLGKRNIEFSRRRFFRSWVPAMAVAYWLLFRVWQPRREYVEGSR